MDGLARALGRRVCFTSRRHSLRCNVVAPSFSRAHSKNATIVAEKPNEQQQQQQQSSSLEKAGNAENPSTRVSAPFWETLLHSPFDGAILALAIPSMLALAADPLLSMVDTAIVGQTGQLELAALGVNNSLFNFAFVVFNFLAVATTPLISTYIASNNKLQAGQTINQALFLAVVLGVSVTTGLILNSHAALELMGIDPADTALMTMATDYLVIRATAAPASLIMTVSQGVFRGMQDTKTPLAVTLATNAVHLGLSYYFIYGIHMGVSGAGLSTTIAEWLAVGAYLYIGQRKCTELGMWPLPDLPGPLEAWDQYLPFLQAGGAILMRTTVLLGTKTLAAGVAARLGPASIGAHQVLSQLWSLSSLVIDSVAIAGQTLVAVEIGRGKRGEARALTNRLLTLGLGLGLALSALLYLASPIWPRLFSNDAEVVALVSSILPLATFMIPVNALVYVLDGVLVGASDFQFLVGAMALASASTVVGLLAIEPLGLGLEGVWAALALLMVGRVTTLGYRYQMADGPLPPVGSTSEASASQLSPESFPEYLEEESGTWIPLDMEASLFQSEKFDLLQPLSDDDASTLHREDEVPASHRQNGVSASRRVDAASASYVEDVSMQVNGHKDEAAEVALPGDLMVSRSARAPIPRLHDTGLVQQLSRGGSSSLDEQ